MGDISKLLSYTLTYNNIKQILNILLVFLIAKNSLYSASKGKESSNFNNLIIKSKDINFNNIDKGSIINICLYSL